VCGPTRVAILQVREFVGDDSFEFDSPKIAHQSGGADEHRRKCAPRQHECIRRVVVEDPYLRHRLAARDAEPFDDIAEARILTIR
jgi:hypothetical protein